MIDKYNETIYTNIIKNYIIYIIQLYLSRTTNSSTIFTDEEYEEMELSIDLIPYIEFLSSKNLGIDNFIGETTNANNIDNTTNTTMEEEYNDHLELEIIKYINNALMQR
jgi:hypothetical protein